LPGLETVPLDALGDSIPWLPLDTSARPAVYYYLFNMSKPPFDNLLVRQAFAAAIDREAFVRIAQEFGAVNPTAATTLTPPETLGRDLYNAIGVRFHPGDARQYLAQAGYTDLATFPPATLMVGGNNDLDIRIAEELVKSWRLYLGVDVTMNVITEKYFQSAREGDIYSWGWGADYNDPDNFLLENFRTDSPSNFSYFSNSAYDEIVDKAAEETDPALRQALYIDAETMLAETVVALIPLFHHSLDIP
jgi:oligopeptide transport system substrate-binding protein